MNHPKLEEVVRDSSLESWYVSCSWSTGVVFTRSNEVISWAPPIWQKFRGQKLSKLVRWLSTNGRPVRVKLMENI